MATEREHRYLGNPVAELRTTEDGVGVGGYAAVYGVRSLPIAGLFVEEIAPGTFGKVLARNPDVRCLLNHDPSLLLGRNRAGTLELRDTNAGLAFRVPKLPRTGAGPQVVEGLERGDLDGCSFGFRTVPKTDTWREERGDDGAVVLIRTLHDIELFDVSIVTYPAYPGTDASLRSEVAVRSLKRWAEQQKRRGKELRKEYLEFLEKFAG